MVYGVYSDVGLRRFIDSGIITSEKSIEETQIQPSSLDLRIGRKLYHLPYSVIPGKNVERYLEENANYEIDLHHNGFLHQRNVYIAELLERVKLPPNIMGEVNPKSSIGRTDTLVRLITEGGESFDNISAGYKGKLFLEIYSSSFDIILNEGLPLTQLRLMDSQTKKLGSKNLESLCKCKGLLSYNGKNINPINYTEKDSICLRLDLGGKIPGLIAIKNAPPVDFSKRDQPLSKYFREIIIENNGVVLEKDAFYLLSSKETVHIPKDYCAELPPIATKSGEFRVHYAGFFDPEFTGTATLEVRNNGASFLIRDGKKITNLWFYRMKSSPSKRYGSQGSSYQEQKGAMPAKFFEVNK